MNAQIQRIKVTSTRLSRPAVAHGHPRSLRRESAVGLSVAGHPSPMADNTRSTLAVAVTVKPPAEADLVTRPHVLRLGFCVP